MREVCFEKHSAGPLRGAGGESSSEFRDSPLGTGLSREPPFPDPPSPPSGGLNAPPPPPAPLGTAVRGMGCGVTPSRPRAAGHSAVAERVHRAPFNNSAPPGLGIGGGGGQRPPPPPLDPPPPAPSQDWAKFPSGPSANHKFSLAPILLDQTFFFGASKNSAPPPPLRSECPWSTARDNSPVSGTADPRSSQTGQVIRGLR